jgi:hypothetical protein
MGRAKGPPRFISWQDSFRKKALIFFFPFEAENGKQQVDSASFRFVTSNITLSLQARFVPAKLIVFTASVS